MTTSTAKARPALRHYRYRGMAEPLDLPFALKSLATADTGMERLGDGRIKYWIRHDVIRCVTPRMLDWWFRNLEGDVELAGRTHSRYRFWHPADHVHVGYARRLPDGTIGPGAAIRIVEVLGRDPRFLVDTVSRIERLDEGGFIHSP